MTRHIGRAIVTELNGEELFSFEHGPVKDIAAKHLRAYCGGDIAVPSIRCEGGANARRISDFPNAADAMGAEDRLTGIRNGENVNFSRAQILAPLVESISSLVAELVAEELRKAK